MKTAIKLISSAALLVGFTQVAMADNRTPAELAETISPSYRSADMQASNGSQFVWVKRIEGHDSNGDKQVLFSDPQGALIAVNKLTQADRLINPVNVEKKGRYQELHLQLADNMLTVSKGGMKQQPLPNSISSEVVLHGELEVNKFEVSASEFSLQQVDGQSLAMFNN